MKKFLLVSTLALMTSVVFASSNEVKQGFQDTLKPAMVQKMEKNDRKEKSQDHHKKHHHGGRANREGKPQGGFLAEKVSTITDADKWQDGQIVVLEGKITKQVGKNEYLFKDSTGEMQIEIGRHAFQRLVTPEDEVKIIADVNKSWGKTEVEVHQVLDEKADKLFQDKGERPQSLKDEMMKKPQQ